MHPCTPSSMLTHRHRLDTLDHGPSAQDSTIPGEPGCHQSQASSPPHNGYADIRRPIWCPGMKGRANSLFPHLLHHAAVFQCKLRSVPVPKASRSPSQGAPSPPAPTEAQLCRCCELCHHCELCQFSYFINMEVWNTHVF